MCCVDRPHDVGATADRATGEPTTDRLGQRHQVGSDAEALRRAAGSDRHARLDLVEDEQGAVLVGELEDAGEIALLREDDPDVHHHRLDDDRRDLAAMLVQPPLQHRQVVEGDDGRQIDERLRCPAAVLDRHRGVGWAHSIGRRLDGHQQRIVMAVIAGFDLDQAVASGEAARETNRVERGFRAAVREAPLRLLEAPGKLLGDDGVIGHRLREVGTQRGALGNRLDNERVGVADGHDAKAVVKVDVFVAVDVPDPAALSVIHEDRLRRGVLKRGGDSSRNELFRLLPELVRLLPLRPKPFLLSGDQFDDATGRDRLGNGAHGFPPRVFLAARAEIASSMQRFAFCAVISA